MAAGNANIIRLGKYSNAVEITSMNIRAFSLLLRYIYFHYIFNKLESDLKKWICTMYVCTVE